ncbi:MAG: tetratricopeptide repeat protein [Pseudomonadota bacterium]
MRRILMSLMLSGLLAGASAWAGYDEGIQAYTNGDFEGAAREFKPLAEKGEMESQYMLGLLYEEGQGLPRDDVEASYWYARSAAQGLADAYFALGQLFVHRKGTRLDRMAAHHWFSLAKDHGHRLADQEMQRNLKAMTPEMADMARNRFRDRRFAQLH